MWTHELELFHDTLGDRNVFHVISETRLIKGDCFILYSVFIYLFFFHFIHRLSHYNVIGHVNTIYICENIF